MEVQNICDIIKDHYKSHPDDIDLQIAMKLVEAFELIQSNLTSHDIDQLR